MAVSKNAFSHTMLHFSQNTTYGDQTQREEYSLRTRNSLTAATTGQEATGGTPLNYFNSYAKFTGTLASGETTTLNFSGLTHQAITCSGTGTESIVFAHINNFMVENDATGTGQILVVKATGTNAFTNIFYGGSGGPSGSPVRPYSPFTHIDYYGTPVTSTNQSISIVNTSATGINYKYLAIGFTG